MVAVGRDREAVCSFGCVRHLADEGGTGRGGDGDKELKVGYIPPQTMWPARSPRHVAC